MRPLTITEVDELLSSFTPEVREAILILIRHDVVLAHYDPKGIQTLECFELEFNPQSMTIMNNRIGFRILELVNRGTKDNLR
jgi:hypothetical protein